MYLQHFNLSENPFTIAPNPHYLYLSEQHREALAHLSYGLNEKNGSFILLTGEVGTGKTTVCRCLLEQIPEDVYVALILNPHLNEQELLETICTELHIPYPQKASSKVLIDKLNAWLLQVHSEGKHAVIIIEEAQNLSTHILEQLRLLTNLETNEQKLLQIILIGQPELLEKLARPELRQLSQRIVARYHLNALTHREVRAYILHRLKIAGGNPNIFSSTVALRIAQISKGVPRVINLLCDRALLGCYAQNRYEVTLQTVEQASLEIFGDPAKILRGRKDAGTQLRKWLYAGTSMVFLFGLLYFFYAKDAFLFFSDFKTIVHTPAVQGDAHAASMLEEPMQEPLSAGSSPPASDKLALRPPVVGLENGNWSESDAYHVLLSLWGVDVPQTDKPLTCGFSQAQGFDCWHRRGAFSDIQRINRPVVLKLISQQDKVFFITLMSRQNRGRWNIGTGSMRMVVAQESIEALWTEEYTVLWKRPKNFLRTVRPGDHSPVVTWLYQQFSMMNRNTLASDSPGVYGSALTSKVRQLQRRCGLQVDGFLGRETVILLNSINTRTPVLFSKRGVCPIKVGV